MKFKKKGKNISISKNVKIIGAKNISIGNNVRIDDFNKNNLFGVKENIESVVAA